MCRNASPHATQIRCCGNFGKMKRFPKSYLSTRKTSGVSNTSSPPTLARGEGRYTMRLPFKAGSPIDIGDSLQIATALYARMEGKLQSRPEISQPYHDFLREYLEQGHMKPVTEKVTPAFEPVYIPHHAMIRESSSTTKLRVVFNASCRTRNGTSLNDHLLVGPKLQQDLPIVYSVIVARWRQCL